MADMKLKGILEFPRFRFALKIDIEYLLGGRYDKNQKEVYFVLY